MNLVKTTEAVGHVLCHDITQIIINEKKDAVFLKGHIITEADIPVLLSIGKDHLYVWENQEGMLHENDAAQLLYELCKNDHMSPSNVKEGKIDIYADCDGLFKVDTERLYSINMLDQIMIATRHTNVRVKKGDKLAGTRVIPLVIEEEKLVEATKKAEGLPLLELKPFVHKKAAIVTTGNEVFYGRIKDTFTPVIYDKLSEYDIEIIGHKIINDDPNKITNTILDFIHKGAELIICTGGMSVDPDDTTPLAIKNTGAEMISYGAPVLPGAMFLLAYYNHTISILGLPGCVMYAKRTIFDLVLTRIMGNDRITKSDLAKLGHGGLCLNCEICNYPNCGFGK